MLHNAFSDEKNVLFVAFPKFLWRYLLDILKDTIEVRYSIEAATVGNLGN